MKIKLLLAPLALALALSVGCVGVAYHRESFSPDGKRQEVVDANARSLFIKNSFDTLNAAVASTNEQRTFSVSRYKSEPDAQAIEAVGTAAGKVVKP